MNGIRIVQGVLHRAGVHLTRYPEHSEYARVLHDFLVGFDVGCVLDVGANQGYFGLALRRLGYAGRIVSFEPVATTFQRLRERAGPDASWTAHRIALGAEDGQVRMRTFAGHENCTLAEMGEFAREWLPSALRDEGVEEVPLRRLDSLVEEGSVELTAPTLLKVDAEGYDWRVLEGAGSRLEQVVGLQLELMVQPVWEGAPTMGESLLRLADLGFQPVAFSVANRARFGIIVVDGLFVNTRFTPDPRRAPLLWNPAGMGLTPQVWDAPAGGGAVRDGEGASWKH